MAEIIIVKTEEEAAKLVATIYTDVIKSKPQAVIGLATGSTPLAVYAEIAKQVKAENIDVSKVKGFALDEYVGLPLEHPESYHSIISKYATEPIGLNPELINAPGDVFDSAGNRILRSTPGGSDALSEKSLSSAGPDYDAAIKASGGIDIQILGIGTDGHIAFNEPGSSLASRTRLKTLTEQTIEDNARFFDSKDEVPIHCVTQGIGTILEAKQLALLAFGEHKADAVAAAIEGPVSAFCPGSALQLHPHATFVIDEAAASKLKLKDYYKWVYGRKPEWQGL